MACHEVHANTQHMPISCCQAAVTLDTKHTHWALYTLRYTKGPCSRWKSKHFCAAYQPWGAPPHWGWWRAADHNQHISQGGRRSMGTTLFGGAGDCDRGAREPSRYKSPNLYKTHPKCTQAVPVEIAGMHTPVTMFTCPKGTHRPTGTVSRNTQTTHPGCTIPCFRHAAGGHAGLNADICKG